MFGSLASVVPSKEIGRLITLKKAKAKLDRNYETFCRMVRKVKHRKKELDAAFQADVNPIMRGEARALEQEVEELSAFRISTVLVSVGTLPVAPTTSMAAEAKNHQAGGEFSH